MFDKNAASVMMLTLTFCVSTHTPRLKFLRLPAQQDVGCMRNTDVDVGCMCKTDVSGFESILRMWPVRDDIDCVSDTNANFDK